MTLMKRMLFPLAALIVLTLCLSASAADVGADPMTHAELTAWAQGYFQHAQTVPSMNDPTDPRALSEDGYAFIYDFGTLYMSKPYLDRDSTLRGLVILSDEDDGPRGLRINDSTDAVFKAFYSENEDLIGSRDTALLYLAEDLPERMLWAVALRDGQRVSVIQYAVHERLSSGMYTDEGVSFTIQDDGVAAIRAWGLDSQIQPADVEATLSLASAYLQETDYRRQESAPDGSMPPFSEEDLLFSGLSFLTCQPEEASALFGEPLEDDWMDNDGGSWLRVMDFGDCELTFSYDRSRQHPRLILVTITDPFFEGPRAVRVDDTFPTVLNRFAHLPADASERPRVLYGEEDRAPYATAEYGEDASAVLRYVAETDSGNVTLMIQFVRMQVSEILIYETL